MRPITSPAPSVAMRPRPALHVLVRMPAVAQATAIALLVASIAVAASVGPVSIATDDVVRVIASHLTGADVAVDPTVDAIVWDLRLPRVLLAASVGAALACSGAAYQGVFRNPLADPYLLGVASGAGLVATAMLVSGAPSSIGPVSVLTLAAFAGALATVVVTYSLARANGHTPSTTLILAGIAVSSICVSATSYLLLTNGDDTVSVLSWLLGGFNDSGWRDLWFVLPYAGPAALVIFAHGRLLNVLQLDEGQSRQVGVDVERVRLTLLIAASLAAAACVAVAGIIGFVGLIVPHVVRLISGPDYRRLLPLATLAGASFLVLADLAARTLISPSELPVGVITSMTGAPFFLWLLRRQRRVYF